MKPYYFVQSADKRKILKFNKIMEEKFSSIEEIKRIEQDTQRIVAEHDPEKNPNAISIIKQPDGNFRGWTQKNGKMITSRTNDPQTVLQELLTHE